MTEEEQPGRLGEAEGIVTCTRKKRRGFGGVGRWSQHPILWLALGWVCKCPWSPSSSANDPEDLGLVVGFSGFSYYSCEIST